MQVVAQCKLSFIYILFCLSFCLFAKKSLVGIGPAAGNDDLRCASYGANDVLETAIKAPGQRPSVFPSIEAE